MDVISARKIGFQTCDVPVGFDFHVDEKRGRGFHAKFGYGITRYVKLVVFPPVSIREVFVRPSVSMKSLSFDVWVGNHTSVEKSLVLEAGLSGWGKKRLGVPGRSRNEADRRRRPGRQAHRRPNPLEAGLGELLVAEQTVSRIVRGRAAQPPSVVE